MPRMTAFVRIKYMRNSAFRQGPSPLLRVALGEQRYRCIIKKTRAARQHAKDAFFEGGINVMAGIRVV